MADNVGTYSQDHRFAGAPGRKAAGADREHRWRRRSSDAADGRDDMGSGVVRPGLFRRKRSPIRLTTRGRSAGAGRHEHQSRRIRI